MMSRSAGSGRTPRKVAQSRRRGSAADPLRKVILRLRERVANAVRTVVQAGEAPSADAFIEAAVVAALRERSRQRVYAAYAEAAADPAFVRDMDESWHAFDVAIGDGLPTKRQPVAYLGPMRRWDVYWADLDPGAGSGQRGDRRPVLVVSNDGVDAHLDVVTVVSATTLEGKRRKVYPFEVLLPIGTLTPEQASIVMPRQIRSISRRRLLERIGRLDDEALQEKIVRRILEHLDIQFEAEELGEG
jgi:mRNA interferase MazF